ncbi:MAG: Uma2 family endonuclease [Salinibacter sp.]
MPATRLFPIELDLSRACSISQADVISLCQTRESYVERFEAFLDHGCRLAWLFDPKAEAATVFRPGSEPETVEPPATLSADPALPGFSCDVEEILDPAY